MKVSELAAQSPATLAAMRAALDMTFTPQALATWRKGLARARSGGTDLRVLCVGDSTTSGIGASNAAASLGARSFPTRLAEMLNSYHAPAAKGLGVPPSILAGNPDTRWTAAAAWSVVTNFGFTGGGYKNAGGAAGSLVYADPAVNADRFDVYYVTAAGQGTISATATGGSAGAISANAATGITKITVSAGSAATTNTVTITATGGDIYVVGVEPWLSTASKIRIANAGAGSSTAAQWAAAGGWSPTTAIKAYAPDLTIISLGINDSSSATAVATVRGYINTVITAAKVSGDVVLVIPPAAGTGASANALTWLPQYAADYPSIAAAAGTAIVDLPTRTDGYVAALMADGVHPNDLGYADIAAALFAGFRRV